MEDMPGKTPNIQGEENFSKLAGVYRSRRSLADSSDWHPRRPPPLGDLLHMRRQHGNTK